MICYEPCYLTLLFRSLARPRTFTVPSAAISSTPIWAQPCNIIAQLKPQDISQNWLADCFCSRKGEIDNSYSPPPVTSGTKHRNLLFTRVLSLYKCIACISRTQKLEWFSPTSITLYTELDCSYTVVETGNECGPVRNRYKNRISLFSQNPPPNYIQKLI